MFPVSAPYVTYRFLIIHLVLISLDIKVLYQQNLNHSPLYDKSVSI
jgi:hypothetical protein